MAEPEVDPAVELGALELASAFRRGDVSPPEVASAYLARIRAIDGALNSFCFVDEESTLRQAEESAARLAAKRPLGPLDGVPVAVKDVVATRDWPTARGSVARSIVSQPPADAPVITRLRDAGAVLVGKTTTPEFGWKAVTDSPGFGVTRNPWDTRTTAGGSSGGSAAAVAAGLAPLALGTDGGGSIRIPSSFCGIAGIKPTQGLVAQWPPSPFGVLSHLGPHARDAQDTALLLEVLAGTSPADPASARPDVAWSPAARMPERTLRIAYSPDLGYVDVRPDVAASVRGAVDALTSLGANVTEVRALGFDDPIAVFETLWYSGAAKAVRSLQPQDLGRVDPGLLEIAEEGQRYSGADYVAALEARVAISATVDRLLERYDVIVTPTLPLDAFEAGLEVPEGWPHRRWMSWTPFTYPFNITGHPAMSLPCGLSEHGLPIGLQLVGRKFDDGLVLGLAAALERALPRPALPFAPRSVAAGPA